MDIRTVYLALGVGYLTFGLALVAFERGRAASERIPHWPLAKLLQAAGMVLIFGRGELPGFLSVTVGNGALLAGFGNEAATIAALSDRPVSRRARVAALLVVIAVAVAMLPMSPADRIGLASLVHVVFFAWPAWTLATGSLAVPGLAPYLMVTYGLLATASAGRAIWAWTAPGEMLLFAAHPLHLFTFGLLYFMMLTSGFGVLMIAIAKVQARVKRLEGILSQCMYCGKIRNAEDAWEQLERYISTHSDAQFSHGICPDCLPGVHAKIDRDAAARRHHH